MRATTTTGRTTKTPAKTATKTATKTKTVTKTAKKPAIKATTTVTKKIIAGPTIKVQRAITAEQRHSMISEAAYYLAEKNGFNPNLTEQCWLDAVKQIDSQILEF
jgi:hypothetical protein